MKFSLKKLRQVFSDKTANTLESDTYIDDIVNDVEGTPFAISTSNVLYAGISELAGYHYFKTIIIGTCQIKTFKGAKLLIHGNNFKLELKSDMVELQSESADSNRNITRIDFEVAPDDLSKISRDTIESLELTAKKTRVSFIVVEGEDEDEEEE